MTLQLLLGLLLVAGGAGLTTGLALAGDHPAVPAGTPSRAQVQDAHQAAAAAAGDVDSVRAALVVADARLESAQVAAAKAGEAFDGARYEAALARAAAREAARQADRATRSVAREHDTYADTVTSSLELSPQLTALNALVGSDGIDEVIHQATTLHTTTEALDSRYDSYRAIQILADVARTQALRTKAVADQAQARARAARDTAQRAAESASAESASVAAERDRLIGRLATLQHVSVTVARQRQHGLEVQAALIAQQAAEHAAQVAAQQAAAAAAAHQAAAAAAAQQAAAQASASASASAAAAASASASATAVPTTAPSTSPTTASSTTATQTTPATTSTSSPTADPTSDPTSDPTEPVTSDPQPVSGSAARAIAFARAQIGDPYVWGAAGPNSWDCSGLVMGAWQAGGIPLPHYSVAQYQDSTPISIGDLQPGDLVFWGSSGSSSSIYHVALYSGNGMIIEAPRTGETVEEVSMYAWITPNFFARP